MDWGEFAGAEGGRNAGGWSEQAGGLEGLRMRKG